MWTIEYDNVEYSDDGYYEWWNVSNGERSFKCDSVEDAEWLESKLNQPTIG